VASVTIERLKQAMEWSKVDQSGLAARIGCTPGAVNQILTGRTRRSKLLPEIAHELAVPLAWLLGRTDELEGIDVELTAEEAGILRLFRRLGRDDRGALRQVLTTMVVPTPASVPRSYAAPIVTTEEGLRESIREALSGMPRRGRDRQIDYLTHVLGSVVLPPEDLELDDEELPETPSRARDAHARAPTR
jgi:transcriptional regulator with XRE-family HTH domain